MPPKKVGRPKGTVKTKPPTPLQKARRNLTVARLRKSRLESYWEDVVGKLTAGPLAEEDPHAESRGIYANLSRQSAVKIAPAKEPKKKEAIVALAAQAGGMVVCPSCSEHIIISAVLSSGKSAHVKF